MSTFFHAADPSPAPLLLATSARLQYIDRMNIFGHKKPNSKEQARESKKEIRHSERDIEKELRNLERDEKKLIADIKAAAAQGNQKVMKTLAGSLVQLRNQKDRLIGVKANLTAAGYRTTMMASQAAVAGTVGNVAKVMGEINSQMDVAEMTKTMNEFTKQTEYMNIKEDMLDDALMDAFDGEGVEEEADSVVNSVLEEIGLHIGSQMADAPKTMLPNPQTEGVTNADLRELEELEKKVAAGGGQV